MDEIFPLVDAEGNVIGSATRSRCHSGSRLLHPVVHLHVFNTRGDIFLQQRSLTKDIQPGKWDTAVGGHVDYGEIAAEAILRETREEIGITDVTPRFLFKYVYDSIQERELVYVFTAIVNDDCHFTLNHDEVTDGRFFSHHEIESLTGKNFFTPNFELEYPMLIKAL